MSRSVALVAERTAKTDEIYVRAASIISIPMRMKMA